MANIGTSKIVGLIMSIIFLVVLLSVAQTLLPTGVEAYYNYAQGYNSTHLGDSPSAFLALTPGFLGWFWALGPFVLVIGIVVALFMKRGR